MQYDIIIIGGGIVGLTLACALAQQCSLSIAIVEAQAEINEWQLSHYHHRVSAISLASKRIFSALNVWDDIKKKRVSPFSKMHVWDGFTQAEINFDSSEIAEICLGFIIENNVIQSALMEKIKRYPNIHFISAAHLIHYQQLEHDIELTLENKRILKAKLAIAADGSRSWLREMANIQLSKENYGQKAMVATVQTELPHYKTAHQVFLDTGPLAFLPLADENISSIVWSLDNDAAKEIESLTDEEFKSILTKKFGSCLGEIIFTTKRYSFPLIKQQTNYYVRDRIALVGDAAHTVHPLAGQGVNIGLLDAACLAEVLLTAIKANRNFANLATLRRYERWRRADSLPMITGIDAIKKIFASEKKSLRDLRAFGLNFSNRVQWIKNIFIQHAVGNRDGLPILAK